jgi:hypothetical protein
MTTVFELKGLLKAARVNLEKTTVLMLDKDCTEIFAICNCINELAELADNGSISAVPVGLYAVVYYLAGVAINIAKATKPVTYYIEQKSKRTKRTGSTKLYKPILRKLLEYQELIANFADALRKDCNNPMLHISSQINVLLEHPEITKDEQFQKRLTYQLELVEELSERLYAISEQFNNNPLLKIDVNLIMDGLVH